MTAEPSSTEPSRAKGSGPSRSLQIRFKPGEYEQYTQACQEAGSNKSEIARKLINSWMERKVKV